MKITERAINYLKTLHDPEKPWLRIAIISGGCSGYSYKLEFVTQGTSQDKILHFDSVPVVIDPKSALFLESVELDFSDGLNGAGFTFSNTKAKRTCGCGSSFSA